MRFLKTHPFAVEAFFNRSLVLTFALPKEQLQYLIPEPLALDLFEDKWAFLAIAMVETSGLRPKGFPQFLGYDFFLTGYRIFVRHTNKEGKNLRGLYILKSETNKWTMAFLGNIFTHYRYEKIDIQQRLSGNMRSIQSIKSGFRVTIDEVTEDVLLPENSPFADWKTARRFAGPLPHTFSVDKVHKTVLTIKGMRENWEPKPVCVLDYDFGFLRQPGFENAVLASAFEVSGIPYHWQKGVVESWK